MGESCPRSPVQKCSTERSEVCTSDQGQDSTVHSSCREQTQATARLVTVLVSRIQKNGTGVNNFVKWKGTFRLDRPK